MKFVLTDNSDIVLKALQEQKDKALTAVGIEQNNVWKEEITDQGVVDTGRFRSSVDYDVQGDKVIVGSSVEYSLKLELGDGKMRARPTLHDSIMKNTQRFKDICEAFLKK